MSRRPGNSVVTTNDKPGGIGRSSYEVKDKFSYHDKQSGNYGRVTTKDSMSSGDYVNRGQFGYKDEYKTSVNVRVGDKRGYTEYSREERVTTRVKYDESNNNSWGGRSISGGCNGYDDCDGNNDNYVGGGGGNNFNDDGNYNNDNINAPNADDDALYENDDDDDVDNEADYDDNDCGVGHDTCYDDDDDCGVDHDHDDDCGVDDDHDDDCGVDDDDACYDDDHDDNCGIDDDACYDDDHDGDFDGDASCDDDWGY